MTLTIEERNANVKFFIQMTKLTKNFIWKEYMIMFPIVDGKLQCPDSDAYRLLLTHTTIEFMKDYTIRPKKN